MSRDDGLTWKTVCVCCRVLQRVAMCCSVLQCYTRYLLSCDDSLTWKRVCVYCSVLQRVATCCSVYGCTHQLMSRDDRLSVVEGDKDTFVWVSV